MQPIVILNICASHNKEGTDHLCKILGKIKDGIFISAKTLKSLFFFFAGKYGSTTKIFDSPLVLVFSYEPPDESKMKKNLLG